MTIPTISKSRFVRYLDCPKLGYLLSYPDRYKRLADPMDWLALHLTGEGTRLGEMARLRFPGGRLVGHVWDVPRAVAETEEALRDHGVTDLFEAAFVAGGLLCRVDVLRKTGDGRVDLIEVKAANGVRDDHVADVGFQTAVVERAGWPVRSVSLMHFDPEYVHPGGAGYDLDALFALDDVTDRVRRWVAESLGGPLESMLADLAQTSPPPAVMKNACRECPYYRQVCAPGQPPYPAYEAGGGPSGLAAALRAAGIEDLRDAPAGLTGPAGAQALVLEAARTGGAAFDRGILRDLASLLVFPVWFVDFETFMPGLPIHAGMRPWQQIPFQWSLHVLEQDGSLRHAEFLQADGTDPRRAFAAALLGAVGDAGSIVVYNRGMESTRLQELARDFPDLAGGLRGLDARIVDLLPAVRQGCYHLDFHGSRSLKAVVPVLAPHLDYQALGLREGTQAMEAYARLIDPATGADEREALLADLRAYCGLDTLSMVEVLKRLLAETGDG